MKSILNEKSQIFSAKIYNQYKKVSYKSNDYDVYKQLMRSANSITANIVEARSGFTKKDFLAKISISLKEAKECQFWLELLLDSDSINQQMGEGLIKEVGEIIKMLSSTIITTKKSLKKMDN